MDKVMKYAPTHTGGGMVAVITNVPEETYVAWPDYDTLRKQLAAAIAERDRAVSLLREALPLVSIAMWSDLKRRIDAAIAAGGEETNHG